MSIRKQPEPAKGGKRLSWKANLLFAAVVLAAAALLFWLLRPRSKAEPLEAVVDFGDGITEVLPLDKDYARRAHGRPVSLPGCMCSWLRRARPTQHPDRSKGMKTPARLCKELCGCLFLRKNDRIFCK